MTCDDYSSVQIQKPKEHYKKGAAQTWVSKELEVGLNAMEG